LSKAYEAPAARRRLAPCPEAKYLDEREGRRGQMGSSARSFEVRSERPERVVAAALHQSTRVGPSGVGLLFLSAGLAQRAGEIARGLQNDPRGQPWLVACARGVLTERGEVEQEPAAAGLVLGDLRAHPVLSERSTAGFGADVGDALTRRPSACALLLSNTPPESDGWPLELAEKLNGRIGRVFGAGTLPGSEIFWVTPGGDAPERADTLALLLDGAASPRVISSSAARLLSPLCEVTRVRGSMVLELDGGAALGLLSESAQALEDQPLVLLAIASGERPLGREGRSLGLRPILGVDPGQGGVLLAEELPLGTRVAFAVRDAHAARADLKAHLETLRRSSAGTAPVFGLFANCAGRGRSLYGHADVDVRIVREQFPEMPLLGLHSTFELVPENGRLGRQIYAALLGIFCRPS